MGRRQRQLTEEAMVGGGGGDIMYMRRGRKVGQGATRAGSWLR
jgi:hypothetical protein